MKKVKVPCMSVQGKLHKQPETKLDSAVSLPVTWLSS